MTTLTKEIFKLSAPYNNMYQGPSPRWLFVCSVGLLRSPTGAAVATKAGINARSCGTSELALIPLSANLIAWADIIFFVNMENYTAARKTFKDHHLFDSLVARAVVLDIPDEYAAFDPYLVKIFEHVLAEHIDEAN